MLLHPKFIAADLERFHSVGRGVTNIGHYGIFIITGGKWQGK